MSGRAYTSGSGDEVTWLTTFKSNSRRDRIVVFANDYTDVEADGERHAGVYLTAEEARSFGMGLIVLAAELDAEVTR